MDVDYNGSSATVAGISFSHWDAQEPEDVYLLGVNGIAEYEPGNFYKRELPCIISLLNEYDLSPDIIIVDGYVYLNGVDEPGLGKHLYDALGGKIAIIGVAKRAFKGIDEQYALYRGDSKNPLYITAEGICATKAQEAIKQMSGKYRNPTLLKKVDQICRGKY